MLSQDLFFKQKIFLNESLPDIRRANPAQLKEIKDWYRCEGYLKTQKIKLFLISKLKQTQKIENELHPEDPIHFDINNEFLYRLYNWWINQTSACHYCGLQADRLTDLHNQEGHINKRWPKRGKSLELDRKSSALSYYDIDNLVLACYWCNNAKTDTFTYEEFKIIGKVFNKIWQHRLNVVIPI